MLLDYWTAHYAEAARNGQSIEEYEDDEFDLEALRIRDDDDSWEPVP